MTRSKGKKGKKGGGGGGGGGANGANGGGGSANGNGGGWLQPLGVSIAKKPKNKGRKKGKGGAARFHEKRGGGGQQQQRGGGGGKATAKAIRKVCAAGDVQVLLSSKLLAEALAGDEKTAAAVVLLMVQTAHVAEAAALLAAPGVRIAIGSLAAALLALPQLLPIDEQAAADLVAAAAGARAGQGISSLGPMPLPPPTFIQSQLSATVLELIAEATGCREAIETQQLGALVRSGKAAVAERVAPGAKAGELLCERDAASRASDDRRGFLPGDNVALTPLGGQRSGAAAGPSNGSLVPPPPAAPNGLPPGWEATTDPSTGNTYYYNRQTNAVSWERPGPPPPPPQIGPPPPPKGGKKKGAASSSSSSPSWKGGPVEAEVAVGQPLVLKFAAESGASVASELAAAGGAFRVDKLASRITYRRALLAALAVHNACEAARAALSGGPPPKPPGGTMPSLGGAPPSATLAAALTARSNGASAATLRQLCETNVRRGFDFSRALAQAEGALRRRLNRSQGAAAAAAATRALTLVQGPPGTGKTATALAIILTWVASGVLGSDAALATSDSNIAVDNLLEGLITAGVRAVRLGRPDSCRPELHRHCVDAMTQGLPPQVTSRHCHCHHHHHHHPPPLLTSSTTLRRRRRTKNGCAR